MAIKASKMINPLFSIIIPSYNYEGSIAKAIKSVITDFASYSHLVTTLFGMQSTFVSVSTGHFLTHTVWLSDPGKGLAK